MTKRKRIIKAIDDYTSNFRKGLTDIRVDPSYVSKYLPKASKDQLLQRMGMTNYYDGIYSDNVRIDRIKGDDDTAAFIRFLYVRMSPSERKLVDEYFDNNPPLKKMGATIDELQGALLPRQVEYYKGHPTILSYEDFIEQYVSTMASFKGTDIANYRNNVFTKHFKYWKHEYDVLPQAFDRRVEMHYKNYIEQASNVIQDERVLAALKKLSPGELYLATITPKVDKNNNRATGDTVLPTYFDYYMGKHHGDQEHLDDLNEQFAEFFNIKPKPKADNRSIQRRMGNREVFEKLDSLARKSTMQMIYEAALRNKNKNMRPFINYKGNFTVPFLGSEKGNNTFSRFLREYLRDNPKARYTDIVADYSK